MTVWNRRPPVALLRAFTQVGARFVAGLVLAMPLFAACDKARNDSAIVLGSRADTSSILTTFVGQIELSHLFTVGELSGPAEYAFGQIRSVVPRGDWGFYACDLQDNQVRWYDSTGHFVRTIGRAGGGPAEYSFCGSMLSTVGDSLIVADIGNGRLVTFDGDGEFIRNQRWLLPWSLWARSTADQYWTLEERPRRGGDEKSWNVAVLRDADGGAVDSIQLPSVRFPLGYHSSSIGTDEGLLSTRRGDSLFALAPRGTALVAQSDVYRVEVRGPKGVLLSVGREVQPIRYRAEERAERLRIIDASRFQPQLPLPSVKPIIRELRRDELGRVWVRLADTSYVRQPDDAPSPPRPRLTHYEQGVWDLFNGSTGEYIGQVRLPVGSRLLNSALDRIWVLHSGADGETLLSAYRMRHRGT